MLPPEMIPAIAVSHLSHHETCQTETRKASYRLAFRHLWHCEKASFATPNTKNHQPSISSTTQPPDHQPITKTRQESRICAKSLSREIKRVVFAIDCYENCHSPPLPAAPPECAKRGSGNVPRRGPVPKFSDLEVVALSLTAETESIDSEKWLFDNKLQEYKDSIPNLISRRQVNDRRKKTAGLCEELRENN